MAISKRMRPTVYLETTIVSYLTSRPSRDIIVLGRQELTRQWWEEERRQYRVLISPLVVEESRKGDMSLAAARLRILDHVESLAPHPDIQALGEDVRTALRIPKKARADALHMAYSIHYHLDYLLTWNCAHLANGETLRMLADLSRDQGLWLPIICTPQELVKEREVG